MLVRSRFHCFTHINYLCTNVMKNNELGRTRDALTRVDAVVSKEMKREIIAFFPHLSSVSSWFLCDSSSVSGQFFFFLNMVINRPLPVCVFQLRLRGSKERRKIPLSLTPYSTPYSMESSQFRTRRQQ